MKPLTDPTVCKPSDLEAHAVLDDDGNPWHPLDPEPPRAWTDAVRERLAAAGALLDANPMLSVAIAAGAGYVVGRLLAARSS